MTLLIDHAVILVADLEHAIADYAALGFNVQAGGVHADGATHNGLVVFADGSYLELIAFRREAPTHRWARQARDGLNGFVDLALLPHDIAAVVAAARAAGLDYAGPVDGGRLRTDGQRVAWQTATPPTPDLPFLCGDVTPRALRVREGEVRFHANGATGIARLTLVVRDLIASLGRWRALLAQPGVGAVREVAGPAGPSRTASLAVGDTLLELVQPLGEAETELTRLLRTRGEGVAAIDLRSRRPTALPVSRTHGAALRLGAL